MWRIFALNVSLICLRSPVSGAPKPYAPLSGLPAERVLLGKEPIGRPQQTLTAPAATGGRRSRPELRRHDSLARVGQSSWSPDDGC